MSQEHRTGLNHDVIAGFKKKSSAAHRVYFHTCLNFIVFASARGPRKCSVFAEFAVPRLHRKRKSMRPPSRINVHFHRTPYPHTVHCMLLGRALSALVKPISVARICMTPERAASAIIILETLFFRAYAGVME